MHADLDPSLMTPDERCREVAAILASGLLRLRDRAALASDTASENPSEPVGNSLEAVPANPLTVHVG
ncbi:MAG: hypothetical protein EXS09_21510 [Gemmataceae bacterium]|nr:hypothetical protein [Gemmataceae bacterium]